MTSRSTGCRQRPDALSHLPGPITVMGAGKPLLALRTSSLPVRTSDTRRIRSSRAKSCRSARVRAEFILLNSAWSTGTPRTFCRPKRDNLRRAVVLAVVGAARCGAGDGPTAGIVAGWVTAIGLPERRGNRARLSACGGARGAAADGSWEPARAVAASGGEGRDRVKKNPRCDASIFPVMRRP